MSAAAILQLPGAAWAEPLLSARREARIHEYLQRLCASPSRESRRRYLALALAEIEDRAPEEIARMERARFGRSFG